jgi:hypothetical protein
MPSEDMVTKAYRILNYGDLTYGARKGFVLDKRDSERLATFLDDAVKAVRLSRGQWFAKTWIGFRTLTRMVHASWNILVFAARQVGTLSL